MRRSVSGFVISTFLLLIAAGLASAAPANVPWPSVAQQLQRDHVKSGSALERLIRNNQDFHLLRAEEARDGRPIPPWLRVYWRKAHPERTYSANDPTGGYPLILHEIHEWMVTHQDLVAGSLGSDAAPEKVLTTGSNLRISGAQTTPRSESDIRINYWNPNKIIAAANDIEASGMQAQYYSSDGGATWGQTSLPLLSGDLFQGDPAVDWTSDGTAWATTLGIINSATDVKVRAYRSTNGGATWSYDGVVSGTQTATDKEMLWVDHSATSSFKDNVYVIWTNGPGTYVNRRTGPSGSWGTPVQIASGSSFNSRAGTDLKTNSAGDVFAFWPGFDPVNSSDRRILVNKSTNGGVSFGSEVTVAHTFGAYQLSIPAQASRTVLIYASAGAYKTSSKNMVYASWTDLTGATGCTAPSNAPGTNTASTCKTRIWFARSTNGGTTWSTPVMINNQSSLNDQFQQHLAVDETNGLVSIVYCDTVADSGRKKADVWYQSSGDDGATWTAASKITSASTDETVSGADSFNQYGDYDGLASYSGVLFPSWTDRRNNAREEIWTAKLQDAPNQVPVASFTYNCTLLSCAFDASGSTDDQGIVSYSWSFGDSTTGSGVSPTHSYAATGSFPVTLTVTDGAGLTGSVTQNAILYFADVPPGAFGRAQIEAIYVAGITSGCAVSPRRYCPDATITRGSTAVFLLKAKEGGAYTPPACVTPLFTDVPCSSPMAPYINEMVNRGIMVGCGGGNFCPNDPVSREQMAYLLLATLGITTPTTCAGTFADVPCTDPLAPWVEEMARRGITAGCGGGNFCPTNSTTRVQTAVFLVSTFDLPYQAKDARVVSQSVPSVMTAGQTYSVSMTVKNAGFLTWSPVGAVCNAYRLGSANANLWGVAGRVDLAATLASGQQVTLTWSVTAPSTPGTYDFQWQMVQECVQWVGNLSPKVVVTVN